MKKVYKMDFDYGHMGSLDGVFIEDSKFVQYLIDNKIPIHFGEVLGKHSDVCGYCDETEIKLISEDQNVIDVIEQNGLESGYNPFYYPLGWHIDSFLDRFIENGSNNYDILSDWSVYDYIDWKINGVIPEWLDEDSKKALIP